MILGSTIDDSIGEAFDKTARVLGITQAHGSGGLKGLSRCLAGRIWSVLREKATPRPVLTSKKGKDHAQFKR